jgi:hypothetical protein
LAEDAWEIIKRSERRLGEMMAKQPEATGGERKDLGFSKNPQSPPTLAQAGIDKNLAQRAGLAAATSSPDRPVRPRRVQRAGAGASTGWPPCGSLTGVFALAATTHMHYP